MSTRAIQLKYSFLAILVLMCASVYADVKTNHIAIANHEIVYDTISEGKSIILLHGLFASKSQWTNFAGVLAENGYHVIIPDLPGYGHSQGFPESDYAIEQQAFLLNEFVTKLNVTNFAIAGNSMGGLIAAKYAQQYPEKISSLAFIGAPLDVQSPKESETNVLLKKGVNPFIPLTTQAFHQEMMMLFTEPPRLSDEQVQKRVARYNQEKDKDFRTWAMVEKNKLALNNPYAVQTSTLIIWGDNDKIFDVSGAEILKSNIKNSKLITVKNGSHLLFMEQPSEIAQYYLDFLKHS